MASVLFDRLLPASGFRNSHRQVVKRIALFRGRRLGVARTCHDAHQPAKPGSQIGAHYLLACGMSSDDTLSNLLIYMYLLLFQRFCRGHFPQIVRLSSNLPKLAGLHPFLHGYTEQTVHPCHS